ncbi:hypothetical protein CYMTET_37099 [Cymbomonas tetramitiformis]|uniref:Uncharacterized protein n=1 Tax=Cymbomonas tetramitiformis TaxID=36881 RepID=A0AAE0F7P8_9CHLO|nr:hypothetical protein CYMTET_37099 [Cymbomonas tetramitiformis]
MSRILDEWDDVLTDAPITHTKPVKVISSIQQLLKEQQQREEKAKLAKVQKRRRDQFAGDNESDDDEDPKLAELSKDMKDKEADILEEIGEVDDESSPPETAAVFGTRQAPQHDFPPARTIPELGEVLAEIERSLEQIPKEHIPPSNSSVPVAHGVRQLLRDGTLLLGGCTGPVFAEFADAVQNPLVPKAPQRLFGFPAGSKFDCRIDWFPRGEDFLEAFRLYGYTRSGISSQSPAEGCSTESTSQEQLEPLPGNLRLVLQLLSALCSRREVSKSPSSCFSAADITELSVAVARMWLDPRSLVLDEQIDAALSSLVRYLDDGAWQEVLTSIARELVQETLSFSHLCCLRILCRLPIELPRAKKLQQVALTLALQALASGTDRSTFTAGSQASTKKRRSSSKSAQNSAREESTDVNAIPEGGEELASWAANLIRNTPHLNPTMKQVVARDSIKQPIDYWKVQTAVYMANMLILEHVEKSDPVRIEWGRWLTQSLPGKGSLNVSKAKTRALFSVLGGRHVREENPTGVLGMDEED